MRHLAAFVLLMAAALGHALAAQTTEIELICPIGEQPFTSTVVEGQRRDGQMLDFKPYGDVVAPNPLAVCPDNGLVMYQREFSADDLARLEALITSEQYQSWREQHTTYYLLAKTFEHMQRDRLETAFMYLQATWEVDQTEQRYVEYADEAIAAFERYLESANPILRDFVVAHLIMSELYRRTGRFADARRVLDTVKYHDESEKPYASRMLILHYQLIDAADASPHKMP